MKDVDELQSYMIHRAEEFLISKGRKLIGWDEILEGAWLRRLPSCLGGARKGNQVRPHGTRRDHDTGWLYVF